MRCYHFFTSRPTLAGASCLMGLMFSFATPMAAAEEFDPKAVALFEEYVEETGGAAAYEAVRTRVIKGEFTMPQRGINGTMMAMYERPDRFYSEVNASAGRQRRGSNGKTVWMIEPVHGPRILSGLERALVLRDATLDRFGRWRELAESVRYVGEEEVDGQPCGKVVLTYQPAELKADDAPVTVYFDRSTGLIKQYDTKVTSPGMLANVTIAWDQYRKVDGILLPHKMMLKADGVLRSVTTLNSVENNVPLPPFELPREIQKLIVQGKEE